MRLFLFLILFCFTSSSLAGLNPSDQPVLDIDSASKSVWIIHDRRITHDRSFKKNATGFFIEPGKFVTNYHVIKGLLEDSKIEDLAFSHKESKTGLITTDLAGISRSDLFDFFLAIETGERIPEESPVKKLASQYKFSSLKVEKILALSAHYDLALLEVKDRITEETPPPLSLGGNLTDLNKDLVILGYPHGIWKQINKTGEFLHPTVKQISMFPVDNHYLLGASGSPVLDNKGQVVGVVFKGGAKMVQMINLPFLKRFVSGEGGQNCKNLGIKECMRQTLDNLRELAKQGDALAQYQLSIYYKERNELRKAAKWLEESAERGFATAQIALSNLYFELYLKREGTQAIDNWLEKAIKRALLYFTGRSYDEFQAWEWLEKAAKHNVVAQYNLGVLYAMSTDNSGRELTKEAHEWFLRSARQGYAPAQELLSYIQGKEVANLDSRFLVEAIDKVKAGEDKEKIPPSGEDSCRRTMQSLYPDSFNLNL